MHSRSEGSDEPSADPRIAAGPSSAVVVSVLNPIMIVEVLSDSTEAYDRGQKFGHYRRLPSLRHYLLVSQSEPRLEVYSKDDASAWMFTEAGAGESIKLRALEISLETDRIYRDPVA